MEEKRKNTDLENQDVQELTQEETEQVSGGIDWEKLVVGKAGEVTYWKLPFFSDKEGNKE